MSEELYVVNTTIEPFFLDEFILCEHRERGLELHANFIKKVRIQYEGFALPYLALFQDGHLEVPDGYGGLIGCVRNGIVGGGGADRQDCSLDEFIDRYRVGEGTIWVNQKTAITAVVEFSATKLYPKAIKKLEQKYEIKRILVE